VPQRPDQARLLALLEATWPAAARARCGPFTLRDGAGGGKRVSAATCAGAWQGGDLDAAEAAMRAAGQPPLFRIPEAAPPVADKDGKPSPEARLETALAARGYRQVDPTLLMAAPLGTAATGGGVMAEGPANAWAPGARVHPVYALWPPLGIQTELWDEDGTDAARRAVMMRAAGDKTALLGRMNERPAGVGFVAMDPDGTLAMMHALAVRAPARRGGLGRSMVLAAMDWARARGAGWLALAVTTANAPARALYVGMGFEIIGGYHYREGTAASAPPSRRP
jgi:GNAT superfamily N-acetyltransferase